MLVCLRQALYYCNVKIALSIEHIGHMHTAVQSTRLSQCFFWVKKELSPFDRTGAWYDRGIGGGMPYGRLHEVHVSVVIEIALRKSCDKG